MHNRGRGHNERKGPARSTISAAENNMASGVFWENTSGVLGAGTRRQLGAAAARVLRSSPNGLPFSEALLKDFQQTPDVANSHPVPTPELPTLEQIPPTSDIITP